MFIETHILQNFAPSNLNRDDTGTPKDCIFGGHRRARISSQCLKRAIRNCPVFQKTTDVPNGNRTRLIVDQLKNRLSKKGKSEEEAEKVAAFLTGQVFGKYKEEKKRTEYLIYVSEDELEMMEKTAIDHWEDIKSLEMPSEKKGGESKAKEKKTESKNKELDDAVKKLHKEIDKQKAAPDIALFGRMLANKPERNIEACCQVAHALSANSISMEMDYYTAVDDLQAGEETGAGMLGFIAFDSACFYRYARVDFRELVERMQGDRELAQKTVSGFMQASAIAVPSGKQNSFAANNPPDFYMTVVREHGMAWSLANAFIKPVYPGNGRSLMGRSIEALVNYYEKLKCIYGQSDLNGAQYLISEDDLELNTFSATHVDNLQNLVDKTLENIKE